MFEGPSEASAGLEGHEGSGRVGGFAHVATGAFPIRLTPRLPSAVDPVKRVYAEGGDLPSSTFLTQTVGLE